MSRLVGGFARFWWNFVIGDDWLAAAGIAAALGAVGGLTTEGIDAWWLLPPSVAAVLFVSLKRAQRAGG